MENSTFVRANNSNRCASFLSTSYAAWLITLVLAGGFAALASIPTPRSSPATPLIRIDAQGVQSRPRSWPGHAPDIAARAGAVTLTWSGAKGAIQALQAASR